MKKKCQFSCRIIGKEPVFVFDQVLTIGQMKKFQEEIDGIEKGLCAVGERLSKIYGKNKWLTIKFYLHPGKNLRNDLMVFVEKTE